MRKSTPQDATGAQLQKPPTLKPQSQESHVERRPEDVTREAIDSFERWVEAYKIRVTAQT
jgi:hypothetical protein